MLDRAHPILWNFRRCPYAIRARLAIQASQTPVWIREILLRDKPTELVAVSAKATVPVLMLADGQVIDESSNIMFWALEQSDPCEWLDIWRRDSEFCKCFLNELDGSFKYHLDRYKYASNFPTNSIERHRHKCGLFLNKIDFYLKAGAFLSGENMGLLDAASLPFVRQFRIANPHWFDAQSWSYVHAWLDTFLKSKDFATVMHKYPIWCAKDIGVLFPKGVC